MPTTSLAPKQPALTRRSATSFAENQTAQRGTTPGTRLLLMVSQGWVDLELPDYDPDEGAELLQLTPDEREVLTGATPRFAFQEWMSRVERVDHVSPRTRRRTRTGKTSSRVPPESGVYAILLSHGIEPGDLSPEEQADWEEADPEFDFDFGDDE